MSGFTITFDRNLQINFSFPYHHTNIEALANAKKIEGMVFPQDFNKPEVIIALRNGSAIISPIKQILPNASFRLFDDETKSIEDVSSGNSHLFFATAPLPELYATTSNKNLIRLDTTPMTRQAVGFSIKKGDMDTLSVLNNWITLINDSV